MPGEVLFGVYEARRRRELAGAPECLPLRDSVPYLESLKPLSDVSSYLE